MKATHQGHCQICNTAYKLPNGTLAKHGYKVQWGMFNGVCPGAANEPYEQSCELIKEIIPQLDDRIEHLHQTISELFSEDGPDAWVQLYGKPDKYATKSIYYWSKVEIEKDPNYDYRFGYQINGTLKFNMSIPYGESCNEIAKSLNEKYINTMLLKNVDELRKFKKVCQKRITDWVLTPLEPLN